MRTLRIRGAKCPAPGDRATKCQSKSISHSVCFVLVPFPSRCPTPLEPIGPKFIFLQISPHDILDNFFFLQQLMLWNFGFQWVWPINTPIPSASVSVSPHLLQHKVLFLFLKYQQYWMVEKEKLTSQIATEMSFFLFIPKHTSSFVNNACEFFVHSSRVWETFSPLSTHVCVHIVQGTRPWPVVFAAFVLPSCLGADVLCFSALSSVHLFLCDLFWCFYS